MGLKELKNRLSEYVRLAAGGETVLVTDRGRVIAELGPPQSQRSPDVADAIFTDAARRGWVTPAALPRDSALPERRPVALLRQILRELDQDRADQ